MGSSIESMKVHHQFTRGLWEDPHHHHHHHHHQYMNTSTNQQYEPLSSLSLGCKRLRPLAPKLNDIGSGGHGSGGGGGHGSSGGGGDNQRVGSLDLKSFIRPESGHRKLPPSSVDQKKDSTQVETHPGGTRWNPTQEQIGILEMLYRGGMRTPTAQQIEQITAQLSKYGKIEGKNVFYWFQNHKARERQKLKRNNNLLALSHQNTSAHTSAGAPTNPAVLNTTITLDLDPKGEFRGREESTSPCKRMCRSWTFEPLEVDNKVLVNNFREEAGHDKTLELFPLHPEGR